MALLEVFCNAFTAFLNHAEDINLWSAVAKLHCTEDGSTLPSRLQIDPNDGIFREFMEIKAYGLHARQEFSQSIGLKLENRDKNRYRDIVPFDKSRVVIDNIGKPDSTGYVNASLIEGLMSCCTYIAAQGPLPGQACDFWRMVVAYQCPVVVMLCDLTESGRSKCSQYWPEIIGRPQTYGCVTVTLLSEDRLPTLEQNSVYAPLCRLFEINAVGGDGKPLTTTCKHFQINGWPDHGVPPLSAVTSLIDLASFLIHSYPLSNGFGHENAPLLIHCSAGCGRTGVFIGLHQICALLKLRQLDSNILSTGLLELVKSLRYQRPSMVQTLEQYVFLYQLVATLLRRVSRSCLKRLVKMGVTIGEIDQDNFASHSPSPPPPKPPDPFATASNIVLSQQQKALIQPPLKPHLDPAVVASGRFLTTEIATELVAVRRNSDWAILRRASRLLTENIPRSVQPLSHILTPPKPLHRLQPAVWQRRASTVETPCILRKSIATPTLPMATSNYYHQQADIGQSNGHQVSTFLPAPLEVSIIQQKPNGDQSATESLTRLEGVEKQLAQLISSVEKLASSPISPKTASFQKRRGMHRRQLSGSYDNLNDIQTLPNLDTNGTVDTSATALSIDTEPQDRIVVDLSNISPPYQNLISVKHEGKLSSPQKEQQNPLLASQPVLSTQMSPPPPVVPPRRRKKEPPQEHHLSVAHLVLNQPNEVVPSSKNNSLTVGESATLGRSLPPRSAVPHSGNTMGLKFVRSSAPLHLIGSNKPLQRQGSLILPTGLPSGMNHHRPNIHFNPIFTKQQRQPNPGLKQQSLSQTMANSDDNPYASLGRFRSVAHLGQIPPLLPLPTIYNNGLQASLDNYPTSMPATPSSVNQKVESDGISV